MKDSISNLIDVYAETYHINRLRRFVREVEGMNDPVLLESARRIVAMIESRANRPDLG